MEIEFSYAFTNFAGTDMVQAMVSNSHHQISWAHWTALRAIKQSRKHIVDNVTCYVLIVQKCHSQTLHLREMCLEQSLYIVYVHHTLLRHINTAKLNPAKDFFASMPQ